LLNAPEHAWLAMIGGMGDATHAATRAVHDSLPPGRSHYFSHLDDGQLFQAAMARPAGQALVLVGHSWGGETAARVAIRLGRAGREVALLVTVDPVKRVLTDGFLAALRECVGVWVNIRATGGEKLDHSNLVAAIGGPWGDRPKAFADRHIDAPFAHREFAALLGFRPPGGESGWDWVRKLTAAAV
jgi:pimeloyl-ACP methyl ester carboxylesterase